MNIIISLEKFFFHFKFPIITENLRTLRWKDVGVTKCKVLRFV